MTPMFLVIVALGTTDLIFALDSIPAIYGLTQEPYLVFTANVFALMGLRQLYFLLGDLLKRLVYLSQGLAVILAFIGVKLILHALHENELPFINGGEHVAGPGDSDAAVPRRHHRGPDHHHRREPVQDPRQGQEGQGGREPVMSAEASVSEDRSEERARTGASGSRVIVPKTSVSEDRSEERARTGASGRVMSAEDERE